MISLDKILLEFVGSNWMSLYILITLLKGMALITKGTKDDKIVTLIANAFRVVRGGKLDAVSQKESDLSRNAGGLRLDAVAMDEKAARVSEDRKMKKVDEVDEAPKLRETPQTSDNIS